MVPMHEVHDNARARAIRVLRIQRSRRVLALPLPMSAALDAQQGPSDPRFGIPLPHLDRPVELLFRECPVPQGISSGQQANAALPRADVSAADVNPRSGWVGKIADHVL